MRTSTAVSIKSRMPSEDASVGAPLVPGSCAVLTLAAVAAGWGAVMAAATVVVVQHMPDAEFDVQ
jgi:hypothetical protein